jgi:hypothetical protein
MLTLSQIKTHLWHWKEALMGPLVAIGLLVWNQATGRPLQLGWFFALIFAGLALHFQLELKKAKIPKEVPKIVALTKPRWVEGWAGPQKIISLVVYFENKPPIHNTADAIARDVRAKLVFYGMDIEQNPKKLFPVDGRWATNPQPAPNRITKEILATDIGIGEVVTLDLAVRHDGEDDLFAMNNENAWFAFKKPDLKLEGRSFLVKVELLAVGIKQPFEFWFKNRGKWEHHRPD